MGIFRYALSAGADFTPTSAYCFNVGVLYMYFLSRKILPQQARIALMWLFLDKYVLLGQILPQQVRIALMWVF